MEAGDDGELFRVSQFFHELRHSQGRIRGEIVSNFDGFLSKNRPAALLLKSCSGVWRGQAIVAVFFVVAWKSSKITIKALLPRLHIHVLFYYEVFSCLLFYLELRSIYVYYLSFYHNLRRSNIYRYIYIYIYI